jgi:hypothetical protein
MEILLCFLVEVRAWGWNVPVGSKKAFRRRIFLEGDIAILFPAFET